MSRILRAGSCRTLCASRSGSGNSDFRRDRMSLPARCKASGSCARRLRRPTPLHKLLRFAMQCGIGAALRGARDVGALAGLAGMTTTPEEMLTQIVRLRAEGDALSITNPHFFCFGGSLDTARWLQKVIDGA